MRHQRNQYDIDQTDRKKRVLFVITQSEFGGAQRFVQTLIPHLDSSKYELLVAAGPKTGIKKQETRNKYPLLEELEEQGFKVVRLKHLQREIRPIEDLRACLELKRLIKTFKPDVLFLCSSKAGMLGSLAGKLQVTSYKLQVIYRIGGWSFNDPWPKWKKKLWIFLEKHTAKYKDVIIVNNSHDLEQAKRLGIRPRQEVKLIHNGLDVSEIDFLERQEARQKLGLSESDFTIGTIANFYPSKGLEYLIEAVHKLQITNYKLHPRFIIIGDGEERHKLELLIANYHLQGRVILYGRLGNARNYLKAFNVYVLPSVKEGFPWAILEAMGAGLSVIATRVGAVPEVIQDGQNGLLVEPRNPAQIADKIEQLLSNDQLRNTLGTHAIQTISEHFAIDQMLRQIEELL